MRVLSWERSNSNGLFNWNKMKPICYLAQAVCLILIIEVVNAEETLNNTKIPDKDLRHNLRAEVLDAQPRSGSEIVIIRSVKTNGCWDASCGVSIGHHPFVNVNECNWSIKYFQWWFAGPTLRSFDCYGNQQCLVCYNGTETCTIETDLCTGNIDQRWFLKPTQSSGDQVQFSIVSEKYPDSCITMYNVHGEGPIHLKLQPCDTDTPNIDQSFYIDSDGFTTVKNIQDRKRLDSFPGIK